MAKQVPPQVKVADQDNTTEEPPQNVVVRLQPTKKRSNAVAQTEPSLKVIVRLVEGLDDKLRETMRRRGDLSRMIMEAIRTIDLAKVPLVDIEGEAARLMMTTVAMPASVHQLLKEMAEQRKTSMNNLVNTAVAHWLATKKKVRFIED